jgi:cytochrome c553
MKILLVIVLAMMTSGCGENDPFVAKRSDYTKAQLADIEDRIKPFSVLNVAGAVEVEPVPSLAGEAKYMACSACHGADGGGGVGPQLAGQTAEYIAGRLTQYKNGEQVGAQSALMWGQAGMLSEADITDLAEYISTL